MGSEELRTGRFGAALAGALASLFQIGCGGADGSTSAAPPEPSLPQVLTEWPSSVDRPRYSPDGRWIAFAAEEERGTDLYIVGVESGEVRRLTDTPYGDLRPEWDPSGRRIVFQSDRDNARRLWILSLDDGSVVPVTPADVIAGTPDWSPRGDLITYVSDANGSWDVWITRPDGTGARAVTNHEGNEYHPNFSPDGTEIVFYPTWSNWTDLYVVDVATGAVREVLAGEDEDYRPVFDPTGSRIVFASDRGDPEGLWWIDAEGGEPKVLIRATEGSLDYPDWSPDGSHILYVADAHYSHLVETSPAGEDGAELTQPVATAIDRRPDVSPDGQTLVYETSRHGNEGNVVVRDLASGRESRVGSGRINDWGPRFSPDGNRIVFTRSGGDRASATTQVLDLTTGDVQRWADKTNVSFPAFCGPNQVVFAWSAVSYDPKNEAWLAPAGGAPSRFGTHLVERTGFTCDPEGRYVVLALYAQAGLEEPVPRLLVVDIVTGQERILTRSVHRHLQPRLSPAGDRVAFIEGTDGSGKAFWVPLAGGSVQPLGPSDVEAGNVAWRGNGRIIFDDHTRMRRATTVAAPPAQNPPS